MVERKALEGSEGSRDPGVPLHAGSPPLGTHWGPEADAGEQESQQPSTMIPSPLLPHLTLCHFFGDPWSVPVCL